MEYKGKPIIPTKRAMDELGDFDLFDVADILEHGFEIRKRKKHIIEKGIQKGSKIHNVVVVDKGNYWKLIHAGSFTRRKKHAFGQNEDDL